MNQIYRLLLAIFTVMLLSGCEVIMPAMINAHDQSRLEAERERENYVNQICPEGEISVSDYYDQAKDEIDAQTYDKNLWTKALVEAEGDQTERRARYIELRTDQLYYENTGIKSNENFTESSSKQNAPLEYAFTGTYRTETITGANNRRLGGKGDVVSLVQTGKKVLGTVGNSLGEIWGEIDGNTITFEWFATGGYMGSGEWSVSTAASGLQGTWISHNHNYGGEWNLMKIECRLRGGSVSDTILDQQPTPINAGTHIDVSGTYRSDIIGSGYWSLGRRPAKKVILKQNKDKITGTFSGNRSGEIEGILDEDIIKFKWYVTDGATGGESGRGEWKVTNDGVNWNGTWRSSRGTQGNWNLTKIE